MSWECTLFRSATHSYCQQSRQSNYQPLGYHKRLSFTQHREHFLGTLKSAFSYFNQCLLEMPTSMFPITPPSSIGTNHSQYEPNNMAHHGPDAAYLVQYKQEPDVLMSSKYGPSVQKKHYRHNGQSSTQRSQFTNLEISNVRNLTLPLLRSF